VIERVLVIVPTYNERENLPPLAARLLALPVPVDLLVVDDRSTDDTAAMLSLRAGIDVLLADLDRAIQGFAALAQKHRDHQRPRQAPPFRQ